MSSQSILQIFFIFWELRTTTTSVQQPFIQDNLGKPAPER